jgi:hypothetical protein
VRGTPDSEQSGNLLPYSLTSGKPFPVYGIEYDGKGFPWGVITPPGSPQAHYVCLWDGNTLFAVLEKEFPKDHNFPGTPTSPVSKEWAEAVDIFLRSIGYKGPAPF